MPYETRLCVAITDTTYFRHVCVLFVWAGVFRALDGNVETGMARNGEYVYPGKKGLLMLTIQTPSRLNALLTDL